VAVLLYDEVKTKIEKRCWSVDFFTYIRNKVAMCCWQANCKI
jgi:hypothetical protein